MNDRDTPRGRCSATDPTSIVLASVGEGRARVLAAAASSPTVEALPRWGHALIVAPVGALRDQAVPGSHRGSADCSRRST